MICFIMLTSTCEDLLEGAHMSPKRPSWKEVIEERQKASFVGRKDYLKEFSDNFESTIPTYLLFFVIGEGGVGKSTLLKQFETIAINPNIDAIVINCDDAQSSPVIAMGYIAEQLSKSDIRSKEFDERYKTYRTRRDEVEADPKAPRGALNLVVRGMTDFAIKTARRTPGIGIFAEYMDEKEAGFALTEGINYLVDRFANKDEIELLREPERILTPLFIELLNNACEQHRLVLMFDVFERTREALEPWLLEFLDFKFGSFDTGLTFVISGRDTVDQRWTQIASSICYIPLEPFTKEETTSYLDFRKITDEKLVNKIFEDTGGLPVLVELLAGTNPKQSLPLPDISKDAVKRFLQWIPEEERRQVALLAAVPLHFNLDILSAALNNPANTDFNWLSVQSYIRTNSALGWFYHEKVRELMLRYLRNTMPGDLLLTHARLAKFFELKQRDMMLDAAASYNSESWRELEVARIYHLLCEQPINNQKEVVNAFLHAFRWKWKFAQQILQVSQRAVHETVSREVQKTIQILAKFYQAYEKKEYPELVSQVNLLLSRNDLTATAKSTLNRYRGLAYSMLDKPEQALIDFTHAIEIDGTYVLAFLQRGMTYIHMDNYHSALADFDTCIVLDQDNISAIINRARANKQLANYDQALIDFNHAIELDNKKPSFVVDRGLTYTLMKNYEQALADFHRAIEIGGKESVLRNVCGKIYFSIAKYAEAIMELNYVLALDENNPDALRYRGMSYYWEKEYDLAMADINRVIVLDEKNADAFRYRGMIYFQKDEYDLAVADFSHAVNFNEMDNVAFDFRGTIYHLKEEYDLAIADFDRALAIDKDDPVAPHFRGLSYFELNRYDRALEDFERALAFNKSAPDLLVKRGKTYAKLAQYHNAIADYNLAISINHQEASWLVERGNFFWETGKLEKALLDYDQALALDPDLHAVVEQKGVILRSLSRFEDAINIFSPSADAEQPCSLCLAHRGDCYRRLGNMDQALVDLNCSIDLIGEEDKSFERSRRAAIYHFIGNFANRDADVEYVISLTSEKAHVLYNKAIVCVLSEKSGDAIEFLKKAIEKNAEARIYARYDDLFLILSKMPEFLKLLSIE